MGVQCRKGTQALPGVQWGGTHRWSPKPHTATYLLEPHLLQFHLFPVLLLFPQSKQTMRYSLTGELGFPGGSDGKEPACQCRRAKRCKFNPQVREIPWGWAWQPTPVFLPGESHGEWSLVDPQSNKESDMTKVTQHACMKQIHGHREYTCGCQWEETGKQTEWKVGVQRCKVMHTEWIKQQGSAVQHRELYLLSDDKP